MLQVDDLRAISLALLTPPSFLIGPSQQTASSRQSRLKETLTQDPRPQSQPPRSQVAAAEPPPPAVEPSPSEPVVSLTPAPTWCDEVSAALLQGHFGAVTVIVSTFDAETSMTAMPFATLADVDPPSQISVAILCPDAATPRFFDVPHGDGGTTHLQFLWALLQSAHVDVTVLSAAPLYASLFRRLGTVSVVNGVPTAFAPKRVRDVSVLAAVAFRSPLGSISDYAAAAGIPLDGAEDTCRTVTAGASLTLQPSEHRRLAACAVLATVGAELQRQVDSIGATLAAELDTEMAFVTAAMSYHGVAFSVSVAKQLVAAAEQRVATVVALLRDQVSFLLGPAGAEPIRVAEIVAALQGSSHSARAEALLHHLRLGEIVPPTADGRPLATLDAHELVKYIARHAPIGEILQDLANARGAVNRIKNALHDALNAPAGHDVVRVNPSYSNYLFTETGRIFGTRPSVQTLPKDARCAVVAPPRTTLVAIDFGQIELRVLAALSRDVALNHALRTGHDVLENVAKSMRGPNASHANNSVSAAERQCAKAVAYGLLYGLGDAALQSRLDAAHGGTTGADAPRARSVRSAFFQAFPQVGEWIADVYDASAVQQCAQSRLSGRKRRFGTPSGSGFLDFHEQAAIGRRAVSLHVQGGAADLLKAALVAVWPQSADDAVQYAVLAPLHDEILFAVDTDHLDNVVPKLIHAMSVHAPHRVGLQAASPLPVTVLVGSSWGAMSPFSQRSS